MYLEQVLTVFGWDVIIKGLQYIIVHIHTHPWLIFLSSIQSLQMKYRQKLTLCTFHFTQVHSVMSLFSAEV